MLKRLLLFIGPFVIRAYMGLLRLTCRIRVVREGGVSGVPAPVPGGPGRFYAFWHGHLLLSTWALRRTGAHVIVSRSRDGETIARVLRKWGYAFIRGSSSRGFVAVYRETLEVLKKGGRVAITPDGPRGPLQTVNPGIVRMSAATGASIVPMGVGYSRRRRLHSWDRFNVPLPFSRMTVLFGAPYTVLGGKEEEREKAAERDLESRLNAITEKAQGML